MSSNSSPVLMLDLRWSPQRWAIVAIQVAICLVMPWLIPQGTAAVKLIVGAAALLGVAAGFYWLGGWGARRVVRAAWLQSGDWQIERADGSKLTASLLDSSQVTAGFISLHLYADGPAGSRHRLLWVRGELDREVWRRLRVRLRLEGGRRPTPGLQAKDIRY